MPFNHSCFISYRHALYSQGRAYTEQIVEALAGELEMMVSQRVFRDTDRLRGAEFYNETLATALCESVCMILLYWPTYFSRDHTFCTREYKAMERLEQSRLQLLPDPLERSHGLIIPIALRDFQSLPAEIRTKRFCYDFEPYTLRGDMRRNPEFRSKIREIGQYISRRCRAFENLGAIEDICNQCREFALPHESEVLQWLNQLIPTLFPFPNRGGSR